MKIDLHLHLHLHLHLSQNQSLAYGQTEIFEALVISNLKPSLNLKEELKTVQRFLGHRARIQVFSCWTCSSQPEEKIQCLKYAKITFLALSNLNKLRSHWKFVEGKTVTFLSTSRKNELPTTFMGHDIVKNVTFCYKFSQNEPCWQLLCNCQLKCPFKPSNVPCHKKGCALTIS